MTHSNQSLSYFRLYIIIIIIVIIIIIFAKPETTHVVENCLKILAD